MRTPILLWLGAAVLLSPQLYAEDPWKASAYTEWTLKDVDRVLFGSPWVRRVRVSSSPRPVEPVRPWIDGDGLTRDQQENQRIAERTSNPLGHLNPIPQPSVREPQRAETYVNVRWLSSVTIRQAIARYWQIQGKASAKGTESLVSYQPEQFAIGLGPISVAADSGADGEAAYARLIARLRETAYLETAKGKKILPVAVEIPRGASLTPAAAVIVYFPLAEAGQPSLVPGAKKVRFHCELESFRIPGASVPKTLKIDVEFDISKMERAGKTDL